MKEGYIYLSRSLLDHWLWEDEPFDKARAWIDLLFLANWEDTKTAYKGRVITCKRGDVNFSISFLADRWKWDRKTVRNFLNLLESDGMVTVKATTHRTTITIENYDIYQDVRTIKRTTKSTTKSQQDGQQSPTINKINKIKEKYIYGEYQNVMLTDEELEKLKTEFPSDWADRIESLSYYMQSTHKKYTDHLATIRNWARRDKAKGETRTSKFQPSQQQNYDFDELEKILNGT